LAVDVAAPWAMLLKKNGVTIAHWNLVYQSTGPWRPVWILPGMTKYAVISGKEFRALAWSMLQALVFP